MEPLINLNTAHSWNKGRLIGQKAPLKLKEIWAIRIRLALYRRARDLEVFNLLWIVNYEDVI